MSSPPFSDVRVLWSSIDAGGDASPLVEFSLIGGCDMRGLHDADHLRGVADSCGVRSEFAYGIGNRIESQ
jgi:hypothetical protein